MGSTSFRPPCGRWLLPALAVPVLALAAATAARNEVWRDEIRLWEDVAAKSPAKARVRLELGRLYLEAGRLGEAEQALQEAIRLAPRDPAPWSTRGVVLRRAGRIAEALESYRQALARGPERADVHYNLGLLLAAEGRLDEAIAQLVAATQGAHPREPPLREHLEVVPHDEHGAGDPMRDDHPQQTQRGREEDRDERERPEQEPIAPLHERARLGVRREERRRLSVGLMQPEPEHDRDPQPGARHEDGVLELEPPIEQVMAAVALGLPDGYRCSGCLGHEELPLSEGRL